MRDEELYSGWLEGVLTHFTKEMRTKLEFET
jgi:hypothetical protein